MANYGICGLIGGNTAGLACDVTRGNPIAMTIGGMTFTPTEYASEETFISNFVEQINQSNGVQTKLFPFPTIIGTDDQTEAMKMGTSGYGLKFLLIDERPSFEFQVIAGSTLEKNLKAFNGKIVPVFVHDDNSLTWGAQDSSQNFYGPQCTVGVAAKHFGDAKNVKLTLVTISYVNSTDFTQNAAAIQAQFSPTDLQGLYDGIMTEEAPHTSNVHHINVTVPSIILGGGINVVTGPDGAALASASNFTAATGANFGTALAITSVAVNGDFLDFTFNSTAYTALATGAQILISSIGVQGLIAATVTRLDVQPLVVVKTA